MMKQMAYVDDSYFDISKIKSIGHKRWCDQFLYLIRDTMDSLQHYYMMIDRACMMHTTYSTSVTFASTIS
jgi:hypothetical protein